MSSPMCLHEGRSGYGVCLDCGAATVPLCGGCGSELPPRARFCPACGSAATPLAAFRASERRQLTIMFCDVVDSTVLAQQMDPEDWREVLGSLLASAAEEVRQCGGHVARSIGDGLLVYFGWPTAHEQDAERAIRAGLAVIDRVRTLPPVVTAGGARLSVRTGIHTGTIVVDDAGEIFGDHANIAARVQAAGTPDSVFISAATHELAAGLFVVEDKGVHSLKGVRDPLRLYRVVQPSGVRSRLDLAAGQLTRFVGRQSEMAELLRAWERTRGGEGQSLMLVAEPGIGKSRLAYQLREHLAGTPHTWLECAATPYTATTPFHPVNALVSQGLGFAATDSTAVKLAKIEKGLGSLESETTTSLLASFLDLGPPLEISPQLQRQRTLELLARWNLAMSAVQPLVLLVEDLHWCDPSTLELLGRLIEQRKGARVLLLATARPEFVPPWKQADGLAVLRLPRLTEEEACTMISSLSGGVFGDAIVSALVKRADGVPLYVEELTRASLDPGRARSVETVPASLADSLMARLDRLSGARQVAQHASVLGREFPYSLLAATIGVEEDRLEAGLAQLAEEQILYAQGSPPHSLYFFKHALMQEVAYASLLKRTRQQLHAKVARVLEERFPERATTEPEVVARHYELAGMPAEGAALYLAAGRLATERSATEEAILHLRRGLALVEALPASRERDQHELRLRMALMSPLSSARSWSDPEYSATVTRARELALAIGDSPEIPLVLAGISTVTLLQGSMDVAHEIAEEGIAAAHRTGDTYDLLSNQLLVGMPLMASGRLRAALGPFLKVIALHDPATHGRYAYLDGVDRGIMGYTQAGMCSVFLGQLDRALSFAEYGLTLARNLDHPLTLAQGLQGLGVVRVYRNEVRETLEIAEEERALAERFGLPLYFAYSEMLRGAALSLTTELGCALATLESVMNRVSGLGAMLMAPMGLRFLADAQRRAGQFEQALATTEMGLAMANMGSQHVDDSEMHRVRAEILLDRDGDDAEEAEQLLETAIHIAREQDARLWELRIAMVMAGLRRRQGRNADGRAVLEPVLGWFTEGLETPLLAEARQLLCVLS